MAFRKAKSENDSQSLQWHAWIDAHRAELIGIGLPVEVFLDESHWLDFMDNGHLHLHVTSGFNFHHLTRPQLAALHRFLEREYDAIESVPALLRWVRECCRT